MQAKKRAKSVKFGSKAQPPKTAEHHHAPEAHHTTHPPEDHETTNTHIESEISHTKPEPTPEPLIINREVITSVPEANPVHQPEAAPAHTQPAEERRIETPIEEIKPPISEPVPEEKITQPNIEQYHEIAPEEHSIASPEQPTESSYSTLGGDTYIVEKEVKKNMLGYFIFVAVISFFIGIASMAGANYFFKDFRLPTNLPQINIPNPMAQPTPTPKPTLTPTPTEKQINLSAYSIEVQNGSGVTGAAAKLKNSLTTDGFKVISTGNADNSDYTETIIETSKDIDSDYLYKLKESLEKDYVLGQTAKIPAAYTGDANIIIIIGSK